MNKEKIKIYVDTSFLHNNKGKDDFLKFFQNKFVNLLDFIRNNKLQDNVSVCLPQIVVEECIQEEFNRVLSVAKDIDNNTLRFAPFGIAQTEFSSKEYYEKIKARFDAEIEKNNLKIISYPDIDLKLLISDAITHNPPFDFVDKGFKDSLIWRSILDDALINNNYKFVLLADDNIFKNEKLVSEFHGKVAKMLKIFDEYSSVEIFLDEELSIGLGIRKISDSIFRKVNSEMYSLMNMISLGTYFYDNYEILKIIPNGFTIDKIKKLDHKEFEAEIKLDVIAKLNNERPKDDDFRISIGSQFYIPNNSILSQFNVNIKYNMVHDSIEVLYYFPVYPISDFLV